MKDSLPEKGSIPDRIPLKGAFNTDHTEITTRNGRLLAELSASINGIAQAKALGIPMKLTVCHYPDSPSRTGRLMHIDALKDMRSNWQPILDGLGWMNQQALGDTPSDTISADAAASLAFLGNALPTFLLNIAQGGYGPQGELPDIVGQIYKTTNGIHAAVNLLALSKSDRFETIISSSKQLYDAAENGPNTAEGGGFISPNDPARVCPAPKAMIIEAIDALLFQRNTTPSRSELPDILPDFERLISYAIIFRQESTLAALSKIKSAEYEKRLYEACKENPLKGFLMSRKILNSYGKFQVRIAKERARLEEELNLILGRYPVYKTF